MIVTWIFVEAGRHSDRGGVFILLFDCRLFNTLKCHNVL
jgi:hypothetical protein